MHAACDAQGNRSAEFRTESHTSDHPVPGAMLTTPPDADTLVADRRYFSNRFHEALVDQGICPCIPGRQNHKATGEHSGMLIKQRNPVDLMLGTLNDWRRIEMRRNRGAHGLMSVICIAGALIFGSRCLNHEHPLSTSTRQSSILIKFSQIREQYFSYDNQ